MYLNMYVPTAICRNVLYMSTRTVNYGCIWNIIWNCGIYEIVKIGSKERKLTGVSLYRRTCFSNLYIHIVV